MIDEFLITIKYKQNNKKIYDKANKKLKHLRTKTKSEGDLCADHDELPLQSLLQRQRP